MRKVLLALIIVLVVTTLAMAGVVTLSWTAPTTNTDGSVLTDLAGYKVYWGTASGFYSNVIDTHSTALSFPLTLPTGTYYFAVTAYNTSGFESGFSNELVKYIPPAVPMPPSGLTGVVTGVAVI